MPGGARAPPSGRGRAAAGRCAAPLAGGGTATLVEYESADGRPCGYVRQEHPDGQVGGMANVGFPCPEDAWGCGAVCLRLSFTPTDGLFLLAGTVAADADSILLRFPADRAARYPLTGPLSRLDPSRRVFMVETHGNPIAHELGTGGDVGPVRPPPAETSAPED